MCIYLCCNYIYNNIVIRHPYSNSDGSNFIKLGPAFLISAICLKNCPEQLNHFGPVFKKHLTIILRSFLK